MQCEEGRFTPWHGLAIKWRHEGGREDQDSGTERRRLVHGSATDLLTDLGLEDEPLFSHLLLSCPPSTRESCLMICMASSKKPELNSSVCKVPFHLLGCDISCLLAT